MCCIDRIAGSQWTERVIRGPVEVRIRCIVSSCCGIRNDVGLAWHKFNGRGKIGRLPSISGFVRERHSRQLEIVSAVHRPQFPNVCAGVQCRFVETDTGRVHRLCDFKLHAELKVLRVGSAVGHRRCGVSKNRLRRRRDRYGVSRGGPGAVRRRHIMIAVAPSLRRSHFPTCTLRYRQIPSGG